MLGDPVSVSKEVSKKAEECSVRVQWERREEN